MKAHHQFIHRLKDQRGATAVIVAIMLVVLIGFAAFAVDIGYLYATKNELQNIADAAALAGAGELGHIYGDLTGSAQSYVMDTNDKIAVRDAAKSVVEEGRNIAGWHNIDIFDVDILINKWDPAVGVFSSNIYEQPTAVRVIARREGANTAVATFFARILGILEVPVGADATAALTAPCVIAELELPIGLSETPFPDPWDPDIHGEICSNLIEFSPTNDSCAGWHNFGWQANANTLSEKIFGMIKAHPSINDPDDPDDDDPCLEEPCGRSSPTNWFETYFPDFEPPDEAEIPDGEEGQDFNFIGGTVSSLFNGGVLDWDNLDENDNPTIIGNGAHPAPFPALFDYFRFRDGDEDDDGAPDHANGKYLADEKWTTTAPVYKGEDPCVNPNQEREIVKFVIVEVIMPNPPPDSTVQARVHCELVVVSGRGGCGGGPVLAEIPNLVE